MAVGQQFQRLHRGDWPLVLAVTCAFCDLALDAFRPKFGSSTLIAAVALIGIGLGVWTFLRDRRLWPGAIVGIAILVGWFAPLYRIGVEYEFLKHRSDRAQIVSAIETGSATPISYPGFPLRYAVSMPGLSDVSAGACGAPKGMCIEFVEFPGFLGEYSGFLFVPDGGDPHKYVDGNPAFIARRWSGNWYFVTE